MHARIDFHSELVPPDGLIFSDPGKIVKASRLEEVGSCFEECEAHCLRGGWAVGFVAYEAARALDSALDVFPPQDDVPLAIFGLFDAPAHIQQVEEDILIGPWWPDWDFPRYAQSFSHIRGLIDQGETYQVNLTFSGHMRLLGRTPDCYRELAKGASVGYGGYLEHEDRAVISLSPELFFELSRGKVRLRPMKGTRPRHADSLRDKRLASELASCPKDRAENVMIVDMMRNDVGRIAAPGSVRVSELFHVEAYPTVWQMTSEVEATLAEGRGLADIFRVAFPCASVTGAPKIATMRHIRNLEDGPRGVYCGAFGLVRPGGDAVFNVAIRTLIRHGGRAVYHVGSGIVHDSDSRNEFDECLLKARAVTWASETYSLLETTRWEPGAGYFLKEEHLERLASSAQALGFPCKIDEVRGKMSDRAAKWSIPMRVRLLLNAQGGILVEATPLQSVDAIVRLSFAREPVSRKNPLLAHKTTRREVYERLRKGVPDWADDVLMFNRQGQVTESTIANVAVFMDNQWVTPPLECGLLPGTMRRALLERGEILEGEISVEDVVRSGDIRLMNSVRGVYRAVLGAEEGRSTDTDLPVCRGGCKD